MNQAQIEAELNETKAWYLSWLRVPGFLIGVAVGGAIGAFLVWVF